MIYHSMEVSRGIHQYIVYTRVDRFSNYLDKITKEPDIPNDIYTKIRDTLDIDKRDIDKRDIDKRDIKELLKKLRLSIYYEYYDFIWRKLSHQKQLLPPIDNNTKK